MSEQLFLKSSFITNELNGIYCAWSKFIVKDSIFMKVFFVLCRDEEFSVSGVLASDVIHASKKDIMCIFRVCKYIYIFFPSNTWVVKHSHRHHAVVSLTSWSLLDHGFSDEPSRRISNTADINRKWKWQGQMGECSATVTQSPQRK